MGRLTMEKPELFLKTVEILIHAFNKGKLENLSACNCAVGNLIAHKTKTYDNNHHWHSEISDLRRLKHNYKDDPKWYKCQIDNHVESIKNSNSGLNLLEYTPEEIERIEAAFEGVKNGEYPDYGVRSASVSSLNKAISVLGKIHKIPTNTVKCIQEHVEKGTYKFTNKIKSPTRFKTGI